MQARSLTSTPDSYIKASALLSAAVLIAIVLISISLAFALTAGAGPGIHPLVAVMALSSLLLGLAIACYGIWMTVGSADCVQWSSRRAQRLWMLQSVFVLLGLVLFILSLFV